MLIASHIHNLMSGYVCLFGGIYVTSLLIGVVTTLRPFRKFDAEDWVGFSSGVILAICLFGLSAILLLVS